MKNKTIIVPILFCVIIAIILIGVSVMLNRKTAIESKSNPEINIISAAVKEFKIDAFRFSYNPNNIKVKKGDKVKIIINNVE